MKHYIIVEVRERDRKYGTDAGDIRGAIHKFIKERGINAADTAIREDRKYIALTDDLMPYKEAKSLFHKAMGRLWRERRGES